MSNLLLLSYSSGDTHLAIRLCLKLGRGRKCVKQSENVRLAFVVWEMNSENSQSGRHIGCQAVSTTRADVENKGVKLQQ